MFDWYEIEIVDVFCDVKWVLVESIFMILMLVVLMLFLVWKIVGIFSNI